MTEPGAGEPATSSSNRGISGYVIAIDRDRAGKYQGSSGPVNARPTIVDGTVYFGSQDGYLYAIDPETGEEYWRYDAGEPDPDSHITS